MVGVLSAGWFPGFFQRFAEQKRLVFHGTHRFRISPVAHVERSPGLGRESFEVSRRDEGRGQWWRSWPKGRMEGGRSSGQGAVLPERRVRLFGRRGSYHSRSDGGSRLGDDAPQGSRYRGLHGFEDHEPEPRDGRVDRGIRSRERDGSPDRKGYPAFRHVRRLGRVGRGVCRGGVILGRNP